MIDRIGRIDWMAALGIALYIIIFIRLVLFIVGIDL